MPISRARAAAFDALLRIEKTDAYASELLHSSRYAKLSHIDHGLLTELVMGVLRWRSALDEVIAKHSSVRLAKLDVEVLTSLRLAAYQLLFLDRIPPRAAINESVELTKRARKRSAAGLVNVVLRKIAEAGRQTLPPRAAHPDWLVARWSANYGSEVAELICDHGQRPPAVAARITDPTTLDELQREGIRLEPAAVVNNSYVVTAGDITATKAFRERRLNVQDEAAQLVALLAGRGYSILDCCAAPGGKARIIAENNPAAQVTAVEFHPHRAALLRKLVHSPNVSVVCADARHLPVQNKFDRVLVDAPCSGTGTLSRNPEIKWRLRSNDLSRLQSYQLEILSGAMRHVSPGGHLVYSTCSLEPEENEHVIEKVLAAHSSFSVLDCREELLRLRDEGELRLQNFDSLLSGPYLRTTPGVHRCDGFFAAILKKH